MTSFKASSRDIFGGPPLVTSSYDVLSRIPCTTSSHDLLFFHNFFSDLSRPILSGTFSQPPLTTSFNIFSWDIHSRPSLTTSSEDLLSGHPFATMLPPPESHGKPCGRDFFPDLQTLRIWSHRTSSHDFFWETMGACSRDPLPTLFSGAPEIYLLPQLLFGTPATISCSDFFALAISFADILSRPRLKTSLRTSAWDLLSNLWRT